MVLQFASELPSDVGAESPLSNYEPFEEQVIGRGRRSVVFRGYDMARQRHVAIRLVDGMTESDPDWRSALFCMGHMHRCLANVLDVDGQRNWVVLELMEGSLADYANSKGLPADRARGILIDCLEGLVYLESVGMPHRGIKPSNVLLDSTGYARLTDARGLSYEDPWPTLDDLDVHMPPEALNATFGIMGPAGDLYCLATTLLHAVLGDKFHHLQGQRRLPFGPTSRDWRQWHASTNTCFEPVARLVPQLDPVTAHVLDRMLMKCVQDRMVSAAEVLAELNAPPNVAQMAAKAAITSAAIGTAVLPVAAPPRVKATAANTKGIRLITAPGAAVRGSQSMSTSQVSWSTLLPWRDLVQRLWGPMGKWIGLGAVVVVGLLILLWPASSPIPVDVVIQSRRKAVIEYRPADTDRDWRQAVANDNGQFVVQLMEGDDMDFRAKEDAAAKESFNQCRVLVEAGMGPVLLEDHRQDRLGRRARVPSHPDLRLSITPDTARVILNGIDVTGRFSAGPRNTRKGVIPFAAGAAEVSANQSASSPRPSSPRTDHDSQDRFSLEVEADGYDPVKLGPLTWEELVAQAKQIDLSRMETVHLMIEPPGATVIVHGRTPVVADDHGARFDWRGLPDEITVIVKKEGYQSYRQELRRKDHAGQWPRFEQIQLEPISVPPTPVFSFDGLPPGARLTVDGKDIGSGPSFEAAAGQHHVVITARGYETLVLQVWVPNEGGSMPIRMQRLDNTPFYRS